MRAIYLALKDLLQIVRDWRAAVFLVLMPVAFTLLFGFAFGGFGSSEEADPRLPVGFLDLDQGQMSIQLQILLSNSEIIRLENDENDQAVLDDQVGESELAAAVILPADYSQQMLIGETVPLNLIIDDNNSAGFTIEGEIRSAVKRLITAQHSAELSTETYAEKIGFTSEIARQAFYDEALNRSVSAWERPPIAIITSQTGAIVRDENESEENSFGQTSPGMMAQFAIAGLMGAAAVMVLERKNRAMQRMLATPISRAEILIGHYLAMFIMIFVQLIILIVFAQLFLRLNYLSQPLATVLVMITTALFAASLGLLIGALAKNEEQVIIFALIPMFVLAALGGAWVPLEITPEGFQRIARLTPVAWIMEGFQDIVVRGQGLEAVWVAAVVLAGYALVLFALAVWRFKYE